MQRLGETSFKGIEKNRNYSNPPPVYFCTTGLWETALQFATVYVYGYLFMHDVWKLSGQVFVTGFHLVMIFLLVLLDQSFVHS